MRSPKLFPLSTFRPPSRSKMLRGVHPSLGGAAHPEHRRRVERGAAHHRKSAASLESLHPQRRGIPFALSEVEGSQERNGAVPPPPKCDTNPLTKAKHLYYIPSDWPVTHPKPKEEPKPRGKPIPGPRGLNVPAHPKGRPTRRPTAQAKAAISSYQRPRLTLPPTIQAMEGPSTLSSM